MGYRICGKPSSQMEWGSDKAQKQPDEKAFVTPKATNFVYPPLFFE
ncbi:hypothetical protein KH566_004538 [Escherichia coli]|nr:hypothetical protein [Escherichia coli]